MATSVPLWQWAMTSIAVPICVGLGGAWLGYRLALRKTRFELRIMQHRATYEELLPALADLAACDDRDLLFMYHLFRSQEAEDRAHEADDQWNRRRQSALEVINSVAVRGELAASKNVLQSLQGLLRERERILDGAINDHVDFVDAHEETSAASRNALQAVRKSIEHEV